ncbi:MAG: hypothetical protein LUG65_07535, partial [Clostridiales bacterium]|nr:hypothetical protein [Clostridiales bacterium]
LTLLQYIPKNGSCQAKNEQNRKDGNIIQPKTPKKIGILRWNLRKLQKISNKMLRFEQKNNFIFHKL